MSEMPSCEAIINELRDEALKYPDTGWLSDLARRDLTWDGQNEIIIIDSWYGSVDVGHLAAIVESLIDKKTQDLTTRLEQAEQAVERAKAECARQKEQKGILFRRATEAEQKISRVQDACESDSYDMHKDYGNGELVVPVDSIMNALDGDPRG